MKASPFILILNKIFKLFLSTAAFISITACTNTESEGALSLSVPSNICERLAARAPAGETSQLIVFITGDWEAKKTLTISNESLSGDGLSVEFDGIPTGTKVRAVCLSPNTDSENQSFCLLGISDEISISGEKENSLAVSLSKIFFSTNYEDCFQLDRDLPGCTYTWLLGNGTTQTTSESIYYFSGGDPWLGENYCTIYCAGTQIVTLSFEEN